MKRPLAASLSALVLALVAGTAPAFAQPTFDWGPDGFEVQRLTRGGSAVVFGLERHVQPWSARVVGTAEIVVDADGDGEVVYRPADGLARLGTWAVVDLVSGEVALGAPAERAPAEIAKVSGQSPLKRGPAGVVRRFEQRIGSMHVLVARPGAGAWTLAVSEGGPTDRGAPDDRTVEIDLDDAEPVGATTGRAGELLAGDVVVGVDPRSLRYVVFEVTEAALGDAREETGEDDRGDPGERADGSALGGAR